MSLTPHRKRFEGQGHARYLTFSCFRRQPLLAIDEPCHWMIEAIAATQAKYPFDLWAWVIMPEHVHLLMRPAEGQTVASIQQCLKQSVARRVLSWSRKHRPQMLEDMLDRQPNCTHTHRFWQRGGGYDRNLWTVSEIHQKISYMHENPVRRGLVGAPSEWKWSSWGAWHREGEALLRVDRETLPAIAT